MAISAVKEEKKRKMESKERKIKFFLTRRDCVVLSASTKPAALRKSPKNT